MADAATLTPGQKTLTPEQKLYVIEQRAEFVSPERICAAWKTVFGKDAIVPSPQSLAIYDGNNDTAKKKLSPRSGSTSTRTAPRFSKTAVVSASLTQTTACRRCRIFWMIRSFPKIPNW